MSSGKRPPLTLRVAKIVRNKSMPLRARVGIDPSAAATEAVTILSRDDYRPHPMLPIGFVFAQFANNGDPD